MEEKKSEKEERIRAITKLYYSNPLVQQALLKFALNREVVPRYFEGFGKRPDMLQYQSDIMGLVNKGATSFHASEELWIDPLGINSEMNQHEFNNLRKGWDLLLDIDSPYFDLSRIAAQLVIRALEHHGVKNYGIKFSGSKGMHIIVSSIAFPAEFEGRKTSEGFPELPRAVTEYLFKWIEPVFMKEAGKIMSFDKKEGREEKVTMRCKQCDRIAVKGVITKFFCPVCKMNAERKDIKKSKRKLRCLNNDCAGLLEIVDEKDYYYCELCKDPQNEKLSLNSEKYKDKFEERRGENVSEHAKFDLVLVAPRHLFRMPYSLHEKTALASIVLTKEELDNFNLKDANPLNVKIRDFLPNNEEGEAKYLLSESMRWKRKKDEQEEILNKKSYQGYKTNTGNNKGFSPLDVTKINEDMYPEPIKKLLKGLKDGKKRGLFILVTFFKSLGYSPEFINEKIRTWNKLNEPPLKEGYLRGQIDWHLKQKKKILPPNYENPGFYKDLGLIDEKQKTKNPLVDVLLKLRKANY